MFLLAWRTEIDPGFRANIPVINGYASKLALEHRASAAYLEYPARIVGEEP